MLYVMPRMLKKLLSVLFGCLEKLSFSKAFLNTPDAWFHPKHAYDVSIAETYGHFLQSSSFDSPPRLSSENKDQILEFVMVFDQLPYHVHRGDITTIRNYQARSFELASKLLDLPLFDLYSPQEQCFLMLPLRHSKQLDATQRVFEKINKLRAHHDGPEYTRFYKATLIDLGVLLNHASKVPVDLVPGLDFVSILDELLDGRDWDSLTKPPLIDSKNKVFQAVQTFFASLENDGKMPEKITVSLSGGVDSMVTLSIIKQLGIDVTAVHIDYGNRDTSYLEAELCLYWCNLLGVPLYIRRIDEIKRLKDEHGHIKDREIYEEVTARVRVGMYQLIGHSVVLGHNYDDATENILANLGKGQHHDLVRMKPVGEHSDPAQLRPLLDVPKSEILALAVSLGIPFSHDSTPEWAKRGLTRRQVIPALQALDPNIEAHLHAFAVLMDDRHAKQQAYIQTALKISDDSEDRGCEIDLEVAGKFSEFDWHDFFGLYCREKGLPFPSMKSIRNLMSRLPQMIQGDAINIHKMFTLEILEANKRARVVLERDISRSFVLNEHAPKRKSLEKVVALGHSDHALKGAHSELYQRVAAFLFKQLKPSTTGPGRQLIIELTDGLGAFVLVLMAYQLGYQKQLVVLGPKDEVLFEKMQSVLTDFLPGMNGLRSTSQDLDLKKSYSISTYATDDYLIPFLNSVITQDELKSFLELSPPVLSPKRDAVFVNDSVIAIQQLCDELGYRHSLEAIQSLYPVVDHHQRKLSEQMAKVFPGLGGSLVDLKDRLMNL